MKKLIPSTLRTALIGLIVLGLFLFIPAWTLRYWQAWVFLGVFSLSTNAIGVYLSIKDPALLERRKNFGPSAESNPIQKVIMLLTLLAIAGLLVFCALDHRYGWSNVPAAVSLIGDVLVAVGLFIDLIVMRENSFGGSTVQTFEAQKVISTGPYALIRHPMYAGVLVMMIGVPPALGSFWGLIILAVVLPVLIWRIFDEEKLLNRDLPGYSEYTRKVVHRLIPYIW